MRYDVIIKYNNAEIAIKLNIKPDEKRYTLPDFLKFIRERYGHTHQQVGFNTDYPPQDCIDMENGDIPITKKFLDMFSIVYRIPRKIIRLGVCKEDDIKSSLAKRIYELRISKDRTQLGISVELGISRSTYAGYEAGKNEPDVVTLIKIADIYNVSLDYLCGRYEK